MALRLKAELKAVGWEGSAQDFRVIVAAVKDNLYPAFTDEELLYRSLEAHEFCNVVRKRSGLPELTDHVINKTLVNLRKYVNRVGID
jgi:hypothetical protein